MTLTTVTNTTGVNEDTTYNYTFALLKTRANETTDVLAFKITDLTTGTLKYNNGTMWTALTSTEVTSGIYFSASGVLIGSTQYTNTTLQWTPVADTNGTLTAFKIVGSTANSSSGTLTTPAVNVNVVVTAVNDAPTLSTITAFNGASVGSYYVFSVADLISKADEADALGEPNPTFRIESVDTAKGTLQKSDGTAITTQTPLIATDQLKWQPASGTANTTVAAFTITAWDGLLASATPVAVSFNVLPPPNNAPTIIGTSAATTINENQTVNPFITVVIADSDSASLTATITFTGANGVLSSGTKTTNGSLDTYTFTGTGAAITMAINGLVFNPTDRPSATTTETTTFTLAISDGVGGTASNAQTTVISTPINDAPTSSGLTGGSVTTLEDTAKTFAVSDFNYSDAESTPSASTFAGIQIFGLPTAGSLQYDSSSTSTPNWQAVSLNQVIADVTKLKFVPALNANATPYTTFQYKVSDGVSYSAAATATINVTPVNDAPVGVDDTNSALKTITMTGNVLTNDTDVDVGATKTVSAVGSTSVSTSAVIAGTYGNLTVNADGSYSYLADATKAVVIALKQPATLIDAFTYTVNDGVLTGTANLTITVQGSANNVPVTTATAIALFEDANAATTGSLSATDPDSDTLLIKAHVGSGSTFTSDTAITTPLALVGTYGTLTLNSNKTYSYALNTSSVQSLATGVTATDTFTYQVDDSKGGYATAPIVVTITGANDVPTFTTLTNSTVINEDTTATITFANLVTQGNEADVDGTVDGFVVKAVSTGTLKIGALDWNATTNNTIDASHIAYWTPAANANGTLNAFTVVAKDNSAAESTAAIQATVSVTAVNDAPTLALNAHELTFASASSAQTVTGVSIGEVDGETIIATVDAINGTLSATANGATLVGTGTSLLTVSGTAANVNLALASLTYTQAGDSDDLLTIHVQDSTGLKAADQSIVLTIGGSDSYQSNGTYSFSADSSIAYPTADPLFINNYGANAVVVANPSTNVVTLSANNFTLQLNSSPTVLDGTKVQFSNGSVLKVNTGSSKVSLYGSYNANGDQLVAGSGGDTLYGYDGGDLLVGGAALDTFYAGNGNDTVVGNLGADVITGGLGNDYFVYHVGTNEGADIIKDFDSSDKINLDVTTPSTLTSIANLTSAGATIALSGSDTLITLTGGSTIRLLGVTSGVDYTDFVLV